MRLTKALAPYVCSICLALNGRPAVAASDWAILHNNGIEAVKKDDFQSAAELFRQSAPLAQTSVQRGLTANDLGVVLHQLNRDAEARQQLETAFRIWQNNPGQDDRLAQTTEALGAVYRSLGDYPAAEKTLREALRSPPAKSDSHALMLNELGDILRELGRPAEARELLEKSVNLPGISVRRKLDATIGLADLDRDAHLWQSAFDRWNQAAETARANNWPALEAASVRGLGVTFLEHGEPARAEPLLRKALAGFEASQAPTHQLSSTLSCLGQLYITEGKLAMAEDALLRGIDLSEKSLGPNHPQVAVLLEMLGDTVAARNEFAQARDYYNRARLIMGTRFGDHSPIAAAVDASWALVEQRYKHNAEAATDFEKALAVLDASGPDVEPLRSMVHQHYAELLKNMHRKSAPAATSFRPASTGGQMPQSN